MVSSRESTWSNCAFHYSSALTVMVRETTITLQLNHLGDDYPEKSIQQRPPCPLTASQHIDPLPNPQQISHGIIYPCMYAGFCRGFLTCSRNTVMHWEKKKGPSEVRVLLFIM